MQGRKDVVTPQAVVERSVIWGVTANHLTFLVLIYTASHRNSSSMDMSDLGHTEDSC